MEKRELYDKFEELSQNLMSMLAEVEAIKANFSGDVYKRQHHASFIHAVTKDGQIGILPGHINLIAPLEVDELKVRRVDDESHVDWIAVNGGIIEVKDDFITCLLYTSVYMNNFLEVILLNDRANILYDVLKLVLELFDQEDKGLADVTVTS